MNNALKLIAPAGGRDDLSLDASRCLRMRFSESSCRCCVDACPHGAINIEGTFSVDESRCTGCLLCTTVCPSGAVEHRKDFAAVLAQLGRVPKPVLGCTRTENCSHATVACLTGLSEEHLVTLGHALSGELTLNLTACNDCTNSSAIPELERKINALTTAGLNGNCRLNLEWSARKLQYVDETVDRRSFFKAFRNTVFKSAAVILSTGTDPAERGTEYAAKRVPVRRAMLNKTRDNFPNSKGLFGKYFDFILSFDERCTSCQCCVAICPSGALKTEVSDATPVFTASLCTGCALCCEFCLDGACRLSRGSSS